MLQRPDIARFLIGRTRQDAINLVGTLNALCGAAHRLAAQRAIESARWNATPRKTDHAISESAERAAAAPVTSEVRAVLVEMALEHLVRLLVEWPETLGQPAQTAAIVGWRPAVLERSAGR